jgi:predicted RNase H-like HicB family nuclease
MTSYIALIEEGKKNYSAVFPDIPGVITTGKTYKEIIRNAHAALALHLEGEEILPVCRNLKQIKETWKDWKEWQKDADFTVSYIDLLPVKAKCKRINITIDENILSRIDKKTHNRSAFIVKAVETALS